MDISYVIQEKVVRGEDYKQAEMGCGVNTMEYRHCPTLAGQGYARLILMRCAPITVEIRRFKVALFFLETSVLIKPQSLTPNIISRSSSQP
jgi:hypothetical protein